MSEQQLPDPTRPDPKSDAEAAPDTTAPPAKGAFVEPDISAPVDVLEATTFFQAVTNGAVN